MALDPLKPVGSVTTQQDRPEPKVGRPAKSVRLTDQTKENARVADVAKMYETEFLREMVKAMRGSTEINEYMKPSQAEKIYREQLDEQYAENWGEHGGIGLQKIIYDQIMERFYGEGKQIPKELRPPGGFRLSNRDVISAKPIVSHVPGQHPVNVALAHDANGPTSLETPWPGKVTMQRHLQDGREMIVLQHPHGVQSSLVFSGDATRFDLGADVDSGTKLGTLSPDSNALLWSLSYKSEQKEK